MKFTLKLILFILLIATLPAGLIELFLCFLIKEFTGKDFSKSPNIITNFLANQIEKVQDMNF